MEYVSQLAYVGIEARDLDSWADLLGHLDMQVFHDVSDGREAVRAKLDESAFRITIVDGESDDLLYLGWEVPDRSALALAERHAAQYVQLKPGSPTEISDRGVVDLLWAVDPLGVRHEIFCGPTVDDARTLAPALSGRFRASQFGFGHATLLAPSSAYETALAFYRDVIGLVESGRRDCTPEQGTPICLLRCNPRQHSLAVVDAGLAPPRRMAHVYVEYTELDFLGKAYDVAQEMGIVTVTLGRHQADHAVSFYLRTPSGTELEIGWDSRMITGRGRLEHFRAQRQPSIWGHRRL